MGVILPCHSSEVLEKLLGTVCGKIKDAPKNEETKIRASVVLMKKNVLDVTDVGSSILDRFYEVFGKGVSLQLISAEKFDPADGKRGKLGEVAYLDNWATKITSVSAKNDAEFNVTFSWDESDGVPGAFIMRNHHHSEFYLRSVTLDDVPGYGPVHFVCNSWVFPVHRYKYDRVFFSNQTYLPSDTPDPLRLYREEELINLRGNGSGQLKEWDRVYDYAYYNDLGFPEKGKDSARPVLGGSTDKPYPRRGRTGRRPNKKDPNSESRLFLLNLNIYVPRDEQFSHVKFSDFIGYAVKSLGQVIVPEVKAIFDKTINEFDTLEDVYNLYEGGIELPAGHSLSKIRECVPWELFRELLRSDGERFLKLPVPDVIKEDKTAWRTDEEFGREMLAGVNPVLIKLLTEFPPTSKLDSALYGDQNSKITRDHVEKNMDGLTVEEALANNKLFILDHHDAQVKSLSITETGLVSHGSHDLDNLHRKAFSNQVSLATSLSEGNGQLEAFKVNSHESYDFQQLKHLSKEDMVKYFNGIITGIRRDHESAIQQRTEEYFSLKRDYLNERRSYVTHRKDEEFDVLRKKIPEVIIKLDCFLLENKKFPAMINNAESVVKLKGELESLHSDNCQLRHSLANKESELKCLEVQVADIAGKLMQQSSNEVNMLKLVASLKSSVEDLCVESSLTEEVHKCAMKQLIGHIRSNSENSIMELAVMRKVYDDLLIEASLRTETSSRCELDDSDIEPLILQELSGMLFKDAVKDAMERLEDLYQELSSEKEIRNSLQINVLQMESEVKWEVDEKEKLKEHIVNLDKEMEHRKKSAMDLSILLSKDREQFELALQEVRKLKEHIDQQPILENASNNVKAQLLEAMQKIDLDKAEIQNLTQKLDQTKKDLTEAIEIRNTALALAQERHDMLILREASGEKQNKVIEAATIVVNGMSKKLDDFECRISGMIKKNNLRLEDVSSHLRSLTKIADEFRRSGLTYRYNLERRCSDLQKAEAEVDLLGDEVDALLRLLEKIYNALDHYSPILKHYPGIIEILELVQRELSGESITPFSKLHV